MPTDCYSSMLGISFALNALRLSQALEYYLLSSLQAVSLRCIFCVPFVKIQVVEACTMGARWNLKAGVQKM